MELTNCVLCGKMFRRDVRDGKYCAECDEEHERTLRHVKDVIQSNPGLTVQELCNLSGVSYRQIMEWIRDGRLIRS